MNSAWALVASVRGRTTQLRWWLALLAGCTLGGAVTGVGLGVLSGVLSAAPPGWRGLLLLAVTAALVLADLARPRLGLAQRQSLIPRDVFARGMARGAVRFGLEYGCGWRTLLPSAAPYLAAAYLLLAALPLGWAVALGAAFGASRALAVLQHVLLGRPGWQAHLAGHARELERAGTLVAAAALLLSATSVLTS